MKKVIVGIYLFLVAAVAYANCTIHTVTYPNGKMVTCQTCCYNGNCQTSCM